jgi:hypothetical protein
VSNNLGLTAAYFQYFPWISSHYDVAALEKEKRGMVMKLLVSLSRVCNVQEQAGHKHSFRQEEVALLINQDLWYAKL